MESSILVALDRFKNLDEALRFSEPLADKVAGFKVHSLIDRHGAEERVVPAFAEFGGQVMADLKLHDIPATVKDRATALSQMGTSILTVHASGGPEMVRQAIDGAGEGVRVIAITVLTSLDEEECQYIYGASVKATVLRLSRLAILAKAHGIVCSPQELDFLRRYAELADLERVVPGIRLKGQSKDDQKRVGAPDEAKKAGATNLVIGRAITQAEDPIAAVDMINDMVASAMAE